MNLIETLVLGSYVFTAFVTAAGAKAFHYLYRLVTNHHAHRLDELERRVTRIEEREP